MERGDKAIVYVTERSGFAATVEITSKGRHDAERAKTMDWDRFYPYIVDILVEKEGFLPASSTVKQDAEGRAVALETEKTILNELEFITDTGAGSKGNPRWNLFLYPSLMRIPEADYRTVASRL